ncbi:MAG: SDR family oxidoreductase [Pirellulaceae bacterium]
MAEKTFCLLTGSTGQVGQYLLKDLLLDQKPLAVLVRKKNGVSSAERIQFLLDQWQEITKQQLPMPVCLEGDTSLPGFGLSLEDRHWVRDHCDTLFHNAASVEFNSLRTGTTWNNNFTSALQALDVCRDHAISHLVFVSTAYVCGNRQGVVYEDDLDCGQGFRNEYEQSKLDAEHVVKQSKVTDCVTVLRPGVVVGDYTTGRTVAYQSFYRFVQFTSILADSACRNELGRWRHQVRLAMDGSERRNFVTVDWLSRAAVSIINDPRCHGKTFHLTPARPTNSQAIEQALQEYFRYDGVSFVGKSGVSRLDQSEEERKFYEFLEDYREYFDDEPIFDRTNTDSAELNFPEPEIDVPCMIRLIDFAVRDRFGKRRKRFLEQSVR